MLDNKLTISMMSRLTRFQHFDSWNLLRNIAYRILGASDIGVLLMDRTSKTLSPLS